MWGFRDRHWGVNIGVEVPCGDWGFRDRYAGLGWRDFDTDIGDVNMLGAWG